MISEKKLTGIVVCGGKSIRMGKDKSKLIYFENEQRYHLYEMLSGVCNQVFISCNSKQVNEIEKGCNVIEDSHDFENIGPMSGLLTAFKKFPEKDFLFIGCDYPLITEKILTEFLDSIDQRSPAASFFNDDENFYEPLLAFYSSGCSEIILDMFRDKNYSLRYFLKSVNAQKYISENKKALNSIDTPEEHNSIINFLNANTI